MLLSPKAKRPTSIKHSNSQALKPTSTQILKSKIPYHAQTLKPKSPNVTKHLQTTPTWNSIRPPWLHTILNLWVRRNCSSRHTGSSPDAIRAAHRAEESSRPRIFQGVHVCNCFASWPNNIEQGRQHHHCPLVQIDLGIAGRNRAFMKLLCLVFTNRKCFRVWVEKSESLQTEGRHFRSTICKINDV